MFINLRRKIMGWIILGVVIVLVIIVIGWYISVMNKIKTTEVKIDESRSGIDVALTKRFDVLTKLLDITKAYAQHEKFTLMETIKMRKGMTLQECSDANSKMTEAAKAINVVAEAYPELKSSENFKQLQITVADVEEHLSAARRAYNSNVSSYNQTIVRFPDSIVAKNIGAASKEFFEADDEKRADVKMDFNN